MENTPTVPDSISSTQKPSHTHPTGQNKKPLLFIILGLAFLLLLLGAFSFSHHQPTNNSPINSSQQPGNQSPQPSATPVSNQALGQSSLSLKVNVESTASGQ